MTKQSKNHETYAKVIAKAWKDPQFKKMLLSDPKAALKTMGVEIPQEVRVHCFENTNKEMMFVLPQAPKAELSNAELAKIAAAAGLEGWVQYERRYRIADGD